MTERRDLLRLAVFEYGEIVLRQVGNQAIVIVDHGGVQSDFVDFLLENIDIALLSLGGFALLRSLRCVSWLIRYLPLRSRLLAGSAARLRRRRRGGLILRDHPGSQPYNDSNQDHERMTASIRLAHSILFWRIRAAAAGPSEDSVSP